jgi:predicted metal-dependent peptidase
MDSYTDQAAFNKLTAAKYKMVSMHPFFAAIALSLPFVECRWLNPPTMATDMQTIYYHPEFVMECSKNELMAVIAHEVLHVAFLHGTRRHSRDQKIWNFACDFAINPILVDGGMTLPGNCLYDEKYLNWSAAQIYEDLLKRQEKVKELLDKLPAFQIGDPGDGSGEGQGKGDKNTIHGGIIDLKDFKDADGNQITPAEVEHAIKLKVASAAQVAKSIGKLPGGLEGLVEALGKPQINWHDYIQNWVKGHAPDDYTWARPNRRMLANHRVYMPSQELKGAGTGVLSIDTSGSVSDAELVKYVTEIVGVIEMCKPEKLIIIQHDAVIQSITEWEVTDDFKSLKVKGRGGTCIAPVFKYLHEIDDHVDWMICFTDMGICDYPNPDQAPAYPVLWAATGPDNAPFGQYIPVKDAMG